MPAWVPLPAPGQSSSSSSSHALSDAWEEMQGVLGADYDDDEKTAPLRSCQWRRRAARSATSPPPWR